MILNELKKDNGNNLINAIDTFVNETQPGDTEKKELENIKTLLGGNNHSRKLGGKELKKFIDKKLKNVDWGNNGDKNKFRDKLINSYKDVFENSQKSNVEQLAKDAIEDIKNKDYLAAKEKEQKIADKNAEGSKEAKELIKLLDKKIPKNESILDLFKSNIIKEEDEETDGLLKKAEAVLDAIRSSITNAGDGSGWDFSPLIDLKKDYENGLIFPIANKTGAISSLLKRLSSADGNSSDISQIDFEKNLKGFMENNKSITIKDIAYSCVLMRLIKSPNTWFNKGNGKLKEKIYNPPTTEIEENRKAFEFFYKKEKKDNEIFYTPNNNGQKVNQAISGLGGLTLSGGISKYFQNQSTAEDFISKILKGEKVSGFREPNEYEKAKEQVEREREEFHKKIDEIERDDGSEDLKKAEEENKTAAEKMGLDDSDIDFSKGFLGFDVEVPTVNNIKDFDYVEFAQKLKQDFEKKLREKLSKLESMEVIKKEPKNHKFDEIKETIAFYLKTINEESELKNKKFLNSCLNDFDDVFDKSRGELNKLQAKLKNAPNYKKSVEIASKLRNAYIDFVSNIAKIYKSSVATIGYAANEQEKKNEKNDKSEKDPVKIELKNNEKEFQKEKGKNALIDILGRKPNSDAQMLARLVITALLQNNNYFETFKKLSKGTIESANVMNADGNSKINMGTSNVFYITNRTEPKLSFKFLSNNGITETKAYDLTSVKSHQYKNINTIFKDGGIDTSLFVFDALNEFRKTPTYKEMVQNLNTYNSVRKAIENQISPKTSIQTEGIIGNVIDRFNSKKEVSSPQNVNTPQANNNTNTTNPLDYVKNNSIKLDLGSLGGILQDGAITFNGFGYDDLALRQTIGNCIAIPDGTTKVYYLVSQDVFNKSQELLKQPKPEQPKQNEQQKPVQNNQEKPTQQQKNAMGKVIKQMDKDAKNGNDEIDWNSTVVTSAAANSMVHDGYNYRKQKLKKIIRRF